MDTFSHTNYDHEDDPPHWKPVEAAQSCSWH